VTSFLEMREIIVEFVLFHFWSSTAIWYFCLQQPITYRRRRVILKADTADINACKS